MMSPAIWHVPLYCILNYVSALRIALHVCNERVVCFCFSLAGSFSFNLEYVPIAPTDFSIRPHSLISHVECFLIRIFYPHSKYLMFDTRFDSSFCKNQPRACFESRLRSKILKQQIYYLYGRSHKSPMRKKLYP